MFSAEGCAWHKSYNSMRKSEGIALPQSLCLSSWQMIKWQLLLCSEGDSVLNTSLAWTLIPHCLFIWTKDLQTYRWMSLKGEWRLCGKVIIWWCKAGACWGFSTSSKGNEILIWFLFHFFSSLKQPPFLPSCPLPDLLMLFLRLSA